MFVGIDQSKRSTAAVAINSSGELVHFTLINPPMSLDAEELIVYQWEKMNHFLAEVGHYHGKVEAIALEGLSFNSVGAGKDLLAGLYWFFRTMLFKEYTSIAEIPVGSIPVTAWRSKVIDAAERKVINSFRVKDGIKKFTVEKLPYEVKVKFEQYVREQGAKKEAIYDLADAYFIAQYRLSLED